MKVQSNVFRLTFAFILLATSQAMAIPLLRETKGEYLSELATIYPDSLDPNLFYFLPNTGSIAKNRDPKDPYPKISLVFEDLDSTDPSKGDGLMSGVFEAGITPELRAELKHFQSQHPGARLTVIPFGKSFMSLGNPLATAKPTNPEVLAYAPDPAPANGDMVATVAAQVPPKAVLDMIPSAKVEATMPKGLSRYFEEFDLPPNAGVAETQEGFNAVLSKKGAVMYRAALTGTDPLNVFLCYDVFGALPTMEAQITMNYSRIYSYFATSASGGWGWWGWSVAAAVEKLIESGDIVIKITGANDKQEDYVFAIAKDLARTYLVPTLSATPGASGSSFGFIQFGFNATYKEERKTATWTLREQKYVTDPRCTTLSVQDLKPYLNRIIIDANAGGKK